MRTLFVFLLLSCIGCSNQEPGLKVAASYVPHAEILEFIKPELKEQGIPLVIIAVDDYNIPNRALADGEVDANFFQHLPFLNMQIEAFHYPIASIGAIELEPMGLYSKKVHNIHVLKEGSQIAIPNDPSNEGRALLLLQNAGLIELASKDNIHATPRDIIGNPKHLTFLEVDAAMIARVLDDVDLAAINTNFALQAGLTPSQDALILESKDSPYANVLVIRQGDETRPDIQALKEALTSEKMKHFLLEKYKGAILPAW